MGVPGHSVETVHVELTDADPIVVSFTAFEAGEHGVSIGQRLIPWHRVARYWWDLPQDRVGGAEEEGRPRPTVRLALNGGPDRAEEIVVDADRFEVAAWTVSYLYRDRVEPERGTAVFRKVHVPWARVFEFERTWVSAREGSLAEPPVGSVPSRPDAG
jgi:hypothetical protein